MSRQLVVATLVLRFKCNDQLFAFLQFAHIMYIMCNMETEKSKKPGKEPTVVA